MRRLYAVVLLTAFLLAGCTGTPSASSCQSDIEAAAQASEGRDCTQQVKKMECPDGNVTYTAIDGCQISELEDRGWTAFSGIRTPHDREWELTTVDCYTRLGDGDTGVFVIAIESGGRRTLDMNAVDFEITMPDEYINYTLSRRGISLERNVIEQGAVEGVALLRSGGLNDWPEPSSYAVYQINASRGYKLEPNKQYHIELTLQQMSLSERYTCHAEQLPQNSIENQNS